jgi:hypothetical protein
MTSRTLTAMPVIARRFILIGLCVISGCSHGEPTADADESDRMLSLLTTSLDAWKEGKATTLASREPPIRFVDDDWAAGRQLAAYRLEDPESFVLPFENVFVNVTLQAADGKMIERKVGYQISLTPILAVLRSEP